MLQDAIAECNEVLGEEQEAPSGSGSAPAAAEGAPAAARGGGGGRGFLFEGQLSSAEPAPQQPNLYDLLGAALGQQLAAAQAQQAQQEGEQQGEQPAPAGPSPDVLEAIERELDAIAVQIMEETGQAAAAQRSAPPASKKVVASLPKERLTEERLAELGDASVCCPVCM